MMVTIEQIQNAKQLTRDAKVKVFSHNDLDGVGCGIVAKLAFKDADVTYCGYDNINQEVADFINGEDYLFFDQIFITDISVNKDVEELINETPELVWKIKLLDHHATAKHLNENDWAFVSPIGRYGKNSGTNMLYDYLKMAGFFTRDLYRDALEVFVEKVRRYDSWEWKEVYNDIEALNLNNLFFLYGLKWFESKYLSRIANISTCIIKNGTWIDLFNQADKVVLDVDYEKKIAYINRKEKQMITGAMIRGKTVGFVFAEQYISELGNELCERHPELDFVAIIDLGSKRVSYRTVKDDIDLGKDIASHFGGGGHPKASGSQIDINIVKMVFPMIFGSEKLKKQQVSLITGKGFIGKLGKFIDKLTK
ncbi:DHH family phosphoesterase [Peribacillus asahii]|uniref:DHH family phosphoesterase n=1 Tax=Peribacillus asahii TaxID=228899 RepID=UPI0038059BB6